MRRLRGERGAVTVEFAFIAPLLVLFLIGAMQVGMVVIGNSVGSNAAREGARAASIRYECADNHISGGLQPRCTTNPSTNYTTVKAAVMRKLVGLVKADTVTVAVICRQGSATGPVILCEKDVVMPDADIVQVTITWRHIGASPFVPNNVHTSVARAAILGRPDLALLAPEADHIAPHLASTIVLSDFNHDGVAATLTMTFDEDLITNAATSVFTVTNSPTGNNTVSAVSVVGRVVTLSMAGTTQNTSPGAMTVALTPTIAGVRDIWGNQATFGATSVIDAAGPVLVGLTDFNLLGIIGNGLLAIGDSVTLTFSEPIANTFGGVLPNGSVTVTDPNGGGMDSIEIPGLTAGPQLTNGNGYNSNNASSYTTSASISKAGNTITALIYTPLGCTPLGCLLWFGAGNDSAPWTFTAATSLVDAAGNAASGSRTISNIF